MTHAPPILITGGVRSGTTWIGRTLCQAPGLRYIHEPFNKDYPNAEAGFVCSHWMLDAEHAPQREVIRQAFHRMVASGPCGRAWRDATHPRNAKTPFRWVKHLLRHAGRHERAVVKDPLAICSAAWLARTFGFQVVVTLRRALSFVGSMKRQGWTFDAREITTQPGLVDRSFADLRAELEHAAQHPGDLVDQAILLWRLTHHHIRALQGEHPDWIFLRHEDLALDPVAGFRLLFERLDVPFPAEMAAYVERNTRASDVPAAPGGDHRYRARDARETTVAWSQRLSPEEVERVRAATSALESVWYPSVAEGRPA